MQPLTLRRKLLWLITARAAVITGLLASAILIPLKTPGTATPLPMEPFLFLLGLMQVLVGAVGSQSDQVGLAMGGWALLELGGVQPGTPDFAAWVGRLFYVPRGGPPIEQRPQIPLTAEQYRLYEENDQFESLWAGRAALCFLAAAGVAVWLKLAGRGRTDD